ncbi:MAG: hypothetical protein IT458_18710 [Planctomycetes bacterium]|nr:hypothetical protein [Planctomycetota bacterium]
MNPFATALPALLLVLAPAAQGPAPDASALLGSWRSQDEDQELLEFRAGGVVRVDRTTLRYRTQGSRLTLLAQGGSIQGTWRVSEPHLTVVLQTPDGEMRTGRYRRIGAAPGPAEEVRDAGGGETRGRADDSTLGAGALHEGPVTPARAGRLAFGLPKGWSVARREGGNLLLNPGLKADDTLDALLVVLSGPLAPAERGTAIEALLRARLPDVAGELAGQEIEMDAAGARVAGFARAEGRGAEARTTGRTSSGKRVTVWIGAAQDGDHYAAVLAVVVQGREAAFLPGARRILHSLTFAPADATADAGLAGLEFGNSTFGSGSSLTTVYAFGADGSVRRRTMFSSSIGGTDSTATGTFTRRGDTLVLEIGDETIEARLELDAGLPVALRIGAVRYRRT